MQKNRDEPETEQSSVIASLRRIHWVEALPSFILSLGYPILFWIFHTAKVHKQRKARVYLNIFGVVFTILFAFYGIESVLKWIGVDIPNEWYKSILFLFPLTLSINAFLYIIVLFFDLHNLFQVSFQRAGKESVSEWLDRILGHKLWAGENTYRFLEHIQEESRGLGRARWLLVGFLSTDIDRKIQRDPDKKGDTQGKIQEADKAVHPVYKITVHDWSVRTYSNFLADNMTHAKRSINWVVDPVDLVTEIIPAHMIEVIVSVGSIIDAAILRTIKDAKNALDTKTTVKWGTLLGTYKKWCPISNVKKRDSSKICNKLCNNCSESFPFQEESFHRQFDYIWYSVFAGTLKALKDATIVDDKIKLKNGKLITWKKVNAKYKERERIVGSLVLPHVDEFRKTACSKKRHIYLGIRPDDLSKPDKRIEKGIENFKGLIAHNDEYIKCIVPRPEDTSSDNGLYSSLLAYKIDDSGKINWQQPTKKDNLWDSVKDKDVYEILLNWTIKLFEHTSGGKNVIKGVFVPDSIKDLDYKGCHDIGFYDDFLVLSSSRGNSRNVTWRVYQGKPMLEKTYFPDGKNNKHVVNYQELRKIIKGTLL